MPPKSQKDKPALLHYWEAPEDAGKPVGFLCTTFTFQADFFQQECIRRFLQLEFDPAEESALYELELEEKLKAVCGSVWVDQSFAAQKRSLRWYLIPIRVTQGILHAKINCLLWENAARITVGSANLTKDGYRRNQEIFLVLDWNTQRSDEVKPGIDILKYLISIINNQTSLNDSIKRRQLSFLQDFKQKISAIAKNPSSPPVKEYKLFPILTGPGRTPLFEQFNKIWEEVFPNKMRPNECWITSPFFDQGEKPDKLMGEFIQTLHPRKQGQIHFQTTGDRNSKGAVEQIHLPECIYNYSVTNNIKLSIACINTIEKIDGEDIERPLHAKSIWWESQDGNILYLVGSSNFTSKGAGIGHYPNLEANMAIICKRKKQSILVQELEASFIEGEQLNPSKIKFQPIPNEDELDSISSRNIVPAFFQSATLTQLRPPTLQITLDPSKAKEDFAILSPEEDQLYNSITWIEDGHPAVKSIQIPISAIPEFVILEYGIEKSRCIVPINIIDQDVLPESEHLQNIGLDILTRCIIDKKTLTQALREWQKRQEASKGSKQEMGGEINPHKLVDNSNFLLQRTRRFTQAIDYLRKHLEQPAATIQVYKQRFNGILGLKGVWQALKREAISAEERIFFLSELILMLSHCQPQTKRNCLSLTAMKKEINQQKAILKIELNELMIELRSGPFWAYGRNILEYTNNQS